VISVSADDFAQEVHVRFGDRGLVLVLSEDGAVREQYQDRTVDMITEDDAVERVLEMFADVPLAAKARSASAERLGVDPEDVGASAGRRR
jgi:hypothetical protein